MISQFKVDFTFGKQSEEEVLPIIRKYFNDDTIQHTTDKFCKFDYFGDNTLFELKSRNLRYNTYKTTLIGLDKTINNNKDNTVIFLFKFVDGLYFIKYEKKVFDAFEIKKFVRDPRSGYNDKPKLYLYIPIENLIKIE
jgi:hypothetical protein